MTHRFAVGMPHGLKNKMCLDKKGYFSKGLAMAGAERAFARSDCNAKTLRAYNCPLCGRYHLTSKEKSV